MRIAKIVVKNLFGLFSYPIDLNLVERITIIHGPNGCGKTTILRMLDSVFKTRMQDLARTPFDEFQITFDNAQELHVLRQLKQGSSAASKSKRQRRTEWELEFRNIKAGASPEQWRWVGQPVDQAGIPLQLIASHIPFLTRIEELAWQDERTDELLSLDDVIAKYGEHLPILPRLPGQEVPKWLKEIQSTVEVHFIQTQRLLRLGLAQQSSPERRRSHRPMVLEYSEELIKRIQTTLAQSVQQSRVLDQTFPIRVLAKRPPTTVTSEQIRVKYQEQQDKQKRLIAAGLIGPQSESVLPSGNLEEVEKQLLWMYLEDTGQKLAVFDEFLGKIEVLTDMINSRFVHKSLTIDSQRGFLFKGKKDGLVIPLEALSSGEQHELVLTYELLFCVTPGSLILIDEPELSLHVGWQHRFLDDLKRISDLARLDFLVATHSPQIIHKRWDLAVALVKDDARDGNA